MREVAKADFYARVGPLNVYASIQPGRWPYTSLWKISGSGVVGKSIGKPNGTYTYFLSDGR
jgi:hypothetical protein